MDVVFTSGKEAKHEKCIKAAEIPGVEFKCFIMNVLMGLF